MSGIGGVGKTTFLGQIRDYAQRYGVRTVYIDAHTGFVTASDLIHFVLRHLTSKDICESTSIADLLTLLSEWTSQHPCVLLFDHFEELVSLESFIRTEMIARLPVNGVMLVFAARKGLSMKWRTDPAIIPIIKMLALDNFSWQQSVDYVKRAGIKQIDLQHQISRDTSGYPLALAFAVQSALRHCDREEEKPFIVQEISGTIIAEAMPHISNLVEGLAFVRTCTQDVLGQILQTEVSAKDFRELGHLSFVRTTANGLVVHDVAREYLLNDLKLRNPARFQALFDRALRTLCRLIQGASGRVAYDISHNLITLCTFEASVLSFPHPTAPSTLSARTLPQCELVTEGDVTDLHRLVDEGMTTSDVWDHHDMLNLLLHNHPESLRVIRNRDGRPAAFAAFLPLYQEVISQLPRYLVNMLQDGLGTEFVHYENCSVAETNTFLSPISCITVNAVEYNFAELLLALKLTGWVELASGKRCLLFSSLPQVKQFYTQLGYEAVQLQAQRHTNVEVFSLDFRHKRMTEWLSLLIKDDWPHEPLYRTISIDALHAALKSLRTLHLSTEVPLAKELGVSSTRVQRILMSALTDHEVTAPLTLPLQTLLRLSYVEDRMSVIEISRLLHIGRSTYYRHLEAAERVLAKVLEKQVNSPN